MFTYEKEITNNLFGLIEGNITLQEFSTWVYNSKELLDSLGVNRYCELISIDHNSVYTVEDIETLINDFYKSSKVGLNNEVVLWLLESMIDATYDLVAGCSSLARRRSFEKGFKYLPIEFVGYDSVIEDLGYHYEDDNDKSEVESVTDLYKKEIFKIAKDFLEIVNKDLSILIDT